MMASKNTIHMKYDSSVSEQQHVFGKRAKSLQDKGSYVTVSMVLKFHLTTLIKSQNYEQKQARILYYN